MNWPELKRESIVRDGRRLAFARLPRPGAPRLAVFHGVLRQGSDFYPLLPHLAQRFELLLLDQRGHGRSERAASYRVMDYVADATHWLRAVTGQGALIYGHSLGAMVAAVATAECPNLVRATILEDPPFSAMGSRIRESGLHDYFSALAPHVGSHESVAELARSLAELPYRDPGTGKMVRLGDVRDAAALRYFAQCLRQVDPAVIRPIVAGHWLDGYDCEQVFRALRCPVLLMQADQAVGGMLGDDDARHMQELAADVLHVRMPGVGHGMHWHRTQEIANLVTNFIQSLDELA